VSYPSQNDEKWDTAEVAAMTIFVMFVIIIAVGFVVTIQSSRLDNCKQNQNCSQHINQQHQR
jgi:hypothetical protein